MATILSLELGPKQFRSISELVYRICGINLHEGKEGLVRTRLAKRVHALGLSSFAEYLDYLEADASGTELAVMVDALTTNKTSFFREGEHFGYLARSVLPALVASGSPIRIWSAGCSTGEEPYTLGMVLHEEIPNMADVDARILATDISARVLAKARDAVYEAGALEGLPRPLLQRYLVREPAGGRLRVSDEVRGLVRFARLNLMESWPMQGSFDVIFCRNVMIYFDAPTQERLVQRFAALLPPGGHLFVGHSESLTSLKHPLRYVQPAVYVK